MSVTTASGVLVIDKPAGLTSQQVVGRCRRLLMTRKVGHAGTLDPMATGVLIIGVNRATRLLGHLALHDKRYLATIRLGQSTNTDDAEGQVRASVDASGVTSAQVAGLLPSLRGDIQQVPSTVSAIKVNGQRAYALARSGQAFELKARQVTVSRFDVLAERRNGPFLDLDVDVECSTGTYIRALARDLGDLLGVGGHLTALRRTRVGAYHLSMAQQLPDREAGGQEAAELTMMTMAQAARLSFATIEVDADTAALIRHGRELQVAVPERPTGLIGPDGDLLALYEPAEQQGRSRPLAVLS